VKRGLPLGGWREVFRRGQSLVQFYLFFILMTFRGLLSTADFIHQQTYHCSSVSDLQRCYDEINMDLQQIHEWATANGLKLNPEKSQVILIHAELICRLLPCWLVQMSLRLFLEWEFLDFELETYGYGSFSEGVSEDLLHSAFFKASRCTYSVWGYMKTCFVAYFATCQLWKFCVCEFWFCIAEAAVGCIQGLFVWRRLDHVSHLESTMTYFFCG
jgi:hypothetical protein